MLPQHDVCVNHIERCLFVSADRKKHSVSDAKVSKPENGLIQARGRLPQFKNLKIVVDVMLVNKYNGSIETDGRNLDVTSSKYRP